MVILFMFYEGHVMASFFLAKSEKVTAAIYKKVLMSSMKQGLDRIKERGPYVFQEDFATAQKAMTNQAWLLSNVPHHW